MWAQTPPGGSTPTHSRRKFGDPATSSDGDHPGAHRALVVVDVVDEQVEGVEPLDQPGLDGLPLVGRHDPGDDVEGPGPVDSGRAFVDGEGHPDGPHLAVGGLLPLGQRLRAELGEVAPQGRRRRPGCPPGPPARRRSHRGRRTASGSSRSGAGPTGGRRVTLRVPCHPLPTRCDGSAHTPCDTSTDGSDGLPECFHSVNVTVR